MSNEFVTRAAAAGVELPDPTGAPDGQVVTTASGALVLATPSGGGPTIGSGTYAARPASPAVGDSYTVTSGVRRGSFYRCDAPGLWSLATVVVPQLGAAVGIFDGERLERLGGSLRRWLNLAPRGQGYNLDGGAPLRGVAAMGTAGLLAHDTKAGGGSTMRGALPTVAAGAPRTVAALVYPTGPFGGAGGNPGTAVAVDWGGVDLWGSFGIVVRTGFTDVWGFHYWGVYEASATSSVEAGPVVVVATYDGTAARLYREGTLIDTHTVALSGAGADGFFAVMSTNNGGETSWGTVGFAGAWDAALSDGEVTTLTSFLRERYGL